MIQSGIIDRENKVELRKLREAVESIEQGWSSDLIDIWFLFEIRFYIYIEVFKMQDRKTIAISEIVKIIEECRYNDELAEGYKREILDQEKVYD